MKSRLACFVATREIDIHLPHRATPARTDTAAVSESKITARCSRITGIRKYGNGPLRRAAHYLPF